jgi:hypothetical protein
MLFTDMTFIGIDASGGRKPFTYAALDGDARLFALGEGEMEEVLAFLGGQRAACVAVNAPPRANQGIVKSSSQMQAFGGVHLPGRAVDMRLAEFQLRERGIAVAHTPAREDLCPAWMRLGFEFYHKLTGMGFKPYPAGDASHCWLETHPHAVFCVLIGKLPLAKMSLEGRLQRQLALYEAGLEIKDPMDFFEEITRHRILKGNLPLELIYAPEALDALSAAYTAYSAIQKPDALTGLGDPQEGMVYLPGELKEKY